MAAASTWSAPTWPAPQFRPGQLDGEHGGDGGAVRAEVRTEVRTEVRGIVEPRGKMHNPVTGSGDMLIGVLRRSVRRRYFRSSPATGSRRWSR
jgi:hypothetical protein